MTIKNHYTLIHLQRQLADYRPQLEKALAAIQVLEQADPESETFSDALATLHVCATILEPYSQGLLTAIDAYTEDN
ncbi:hypothetical protein GlitD10_1565 [Gloeomargarita lithophora Alchichica-D10]|uniref:Uncharacterized protein n=1 Tax=Gloeomargarita lithophora Alchichica-D10 TaxID=1188229 RepID=A0A1J0ADA3_9CYAN|nr:hypothetical protein [Gloeomargarita lithophora]APB33888.1 hypothetical protein GlitD10_1565 [Gloeomargarita lithophora Alchichica-D10]